jgi:hypothetical protein
MYFPFFKKSHKECLLSQYPQQHCYDSLKTLPGFEPTFYVPLADAMTNALCRQGVKYYIKVAGQKYLVTRFSDEVCPFFILRF